MQCLCLYTLRIDSQKVLTLLHSKIYSRIDQKAIEINGNLCIDGKRFGSAPSSYCFEYGIAIAIY